MPAAAAARKRALGVEFADATRMMSLIPIPSLPITSRSGIAFASMSYFSFSSTPLPKFVLHQPVAMEEDRTTEFKEVTSLKPASMIIDTVEDYAVGFLN